MRSTRTDDAALVDAAQAGDRRALEELAATYLPLVYTIVRRGLGGHPDVDDVVQDVMLRALRQLPSLRTPATFRAWLAAIAIRQVGTHLRRRERHAARTTGIEHATGLPDEYGPSESLTVLRTDLSRQRRQVERAGHWLDPDDRALLPLWWLEVAQQLTRSELAAALGVGVAHAGVRIQRMRTQLEAGRVLVAALDARPRCPRLASVADGWDGVPSPLWRKRLTRHVRSCPICSRAGDGLVATDRLLPLLALLPVPAGLGVTLIGKLTAEGAGASAVALGTAAKAGLLTQFAQAVVVHPIVATVAAGTLATGATVTTVHLAGPPVSPPTAAAAGSPVTGTLVPGPLSLEARSAAGRYAAAAGDLGVLVEAGPGADAVTRSRATFTAVAGLADGSCFSFRAADGRYLRHSSWRVRLSPDEGTPLFRGDATFCPRPGVAADAVTLESANYPGWFLRHRADELWVDQSDGSTAFREDGSFLVRPPLTR